MQNINTLSIAIKYSQQNNIEEWIHLFLNGEGNNTALSDGLKLEKRFFAGPLKMPLTIFQRCCGPENDMKFVIDETGFNSRIQAIYEKFKSGWDMPPLIINYENRKFELSDGNHRYEALVRNNYSEYYAIIWTTSASDLEDFLSKGYTKI